MLTVLRFFATFFQSVVVTRFAATITGFFLLLKRIKPTDDVSSCTLLNSLWRNTFSGCDIHKCFALKEVLFDPFLLRGRQIINRIMKLCPFHILLKRIDNHFRVVLFKSTILIRKEISVFCIAKSKLSVVAMKSHNGKHHFSRKINY